MGTTERRPDFSSPTCDWARDEPRPDAPIDKSPSRWPTWLVVVAVLTIPATLILPILYYWSSSDTELAGDSASSSAVAEIPPDERAAPVAVSGTTLDGETFDLIATRGQVVVLNVWGSWCVPCREEAPALARLSQEFSDVAFVGIDVRDNPASARAFEERYGITYPSLDDPAGLSLLPLREVVPTKAVPSTIVLDREGRVASRVIGLLDESVLRALIRAAEAEATSG